MLKTSISGRELRHGTPEEKLLPGEVLTVEKRGGKVFELRRVDLGPRDINEEIDRLFMEMPPTGPACKVNAAAIIIQDRE